VRLTTFRFLWSQAWFNVRRSLSPSAATVIVIALIVLGSLLAVIRNTQSVSRDLVMSFQVVAYMKADSSAQDTANAAAGISAIPGVVAVSVRTKEEELDRLLVRFPEYRQVISHLEVNPLVDVIVIDLDDPSRAANVSMLVSQIEEVDEVVYGTEAAERLAAFSAGLRLLSVFGTAFLIVAVSLVVGNVVGLTVEYRTPEIEVASLVGATAWFIRLPFILEALFLGIMSWLASASVVGLLYIPVVRFFQKMMPFVTFAGTFKDVAVICLQMLIISVISSQIATLVALERAMASLRKR